MQKLFLITSIILILSTYCLAQNDTVNGQDNRQRNDNIIITILYNNISANDSIIADHGFSCLIESGDHRCLFDAGRISNIFITNVNKMRVDCSGIDYIFISHVHDDHMGGLFDILDKCNKPALCMPVSYPRQEGESFGDQADREYETMLDQLRPFVSELIQHEALANFGNNFYTTGIIEKHSYEQSLIVPTSKGLVIITGCAHPGILEIVRYAKELMKQDIYFVMGGFHLISTDSTRIKTIAQELRKLTKYIGPCHCTGDKAREIFKDIFGEDYIDIKAGLKFKLGDTKLE
ncbi:MAG: MBL fold metallo-hydrolase [Candidatus Zixiibacteriota bacterium]|nr:MAG: MBL fold metallo-hydrolase [candidate division Zixibacteria bacterium]